MQFNGTEIELPLIKLAYWAGGNPFAHHQDRNEMLRAWRELDTFIVHDFQWTATARHADIVLPCTTSYERNDIEQVGDYALSHIVAMKKIVEPQFEIYSRTIAGYNYDDCPPHPTWMEPIERLDGPTTKYPLSIASNHPRYRLHSQLNGTSLRKLYAVQEREPCWINPRDAAERNIKDGDVVRVYNDRGQILAGAVVSEDVMPGVVRIQEGGWFDPLDPRETGSLCRYGDVNLLTPGIATSKLAQANCGQTGVAEVEKFAGELPEVLVFSQPKPIVSPRASHAASTES